MLDTARPVLYLTILSSLQSQTKMYGKVKKGIALTVVPFSACPLPATIERHAFFVREISEEG